MSISDRTADAPANATNAAVKIEGLFDPASPLGPSFRCAISDQINSFLNTIEDQIGNISPLSTQLLTLARNFTASGKRFRPAFSYWGYVAVSGQPIDPSSLLRAVSGFELLHVSALIHDDVIDGSDTRRGMLSAHRQLEQFHRANHGSGDPAAFGRSSAILLGDLLAAWSTQCFTTAGLDEVVFHRASSLLDDVRTEVNLGQFLDISAEAELLAGADVLKTAEQVVEYKTSRYTVIRPIQFGATLAGANKKLLLDLSEIGSSVGRAFQFRDDLLGVFGDEKITGKPAGDDLRENKRTVLVADALLRNPGFIKYLGRELSPEDLKIARTLLTESGAVDRLKARIEDDAAAAHYLLDQLEITDEGRTALHHLITDAVQRNY